MEDTTLEGLRLYWDLSPSPASCSRRRVLTALDRHLQVCSVEALPVTSLNRPYASIAAASGLSSWL